MTESWCDSTNSINLSSTWLVSGARMSPSTPGRSSLTSGGKSAPMGSGSFISRREFGFLISSPAWPRPVWPCRSWAAPTVSHSLGRSRRRLTVGIGTSLHFPMSSGRYISSLTAVRSCGSNGRAIQSHVQITQTKICWLYFPARKPRSFETIASSMQSGSHSGASVSSIRWSSKYDASSGSLRW